MNKPLAMNLSRDAAILLDFEASDEKSAIMTVTALLEGHPDIADYEAFRAAVWDRQCLQPPLLGNGVALPHARTAATREIVFAIGRLLTPIPFGKEKSPVSLIFLYGTPPGQIVPSLALVADLAKKLRHPEILSALMEARTEADFRNSVA